MVTKRQTIGSLSSLFQQLQKRIGCLFSLFQWLQKGNQLAFFCSFQGSKRQPIGCLSLCSVSKWAKRQPIGCLFVLCSVFQWPKRQPIGCLFAVPAVKKGNRLPVFLPSKGQKGSQLVVFFCSFNGYKKDSQLAVFDNSNGQKGKLIGFFPCCALCSNGEKRQPIVCLSMLCFVFQWTKR